MQELKFRDLKSTDIPNGVLIGGFYGNILFDLDEMGTLIKCDNVWGSNIGKLNDLKDVIKNGLIQPFIFILVHVVKGESNCLIRYLSVNDIDFESNQDNNDTLSNIKKLSRLVKTLWKDYMGNDIDV